MNLIKIALSMMFLMAFIGSIVIVYLKKENTRLLDKLWKGRTAREELYQEFTALQKKNKKDNAHCDLVTSKILHKNHELRKESGCQKK